MVQKMAAVRSLWPPTKRTVIIFGVACLILLMVGLNVYRVNKKEVVLVKTDTVKADKIESIVLASGKVTAPNREDIIAQVSGTVKEIKVELGQEVEAGQPLMILQATDAGAKIHQAEAALATAQSNLASTRATGRTTQYVQTEDTWRQADAGWRNAQQRLERMTALYQEGAASKEQLESAELELKLKESQYKSALAQFEAAKASSPSSLQALEAQVAEAKATLDMLRDQASSTGLKSPRSGRILQISVNKGDAVNSGNPLITVGDLQSLEIKTDISEVDIAKIKVGQSVVINGDAAPNEDYFGTVKEIGLMAVVKIKNQGEVTSVPVIVKVPDGTSLKPGYNVDLHITTASHESALVVPFEAVVLKNKQSYVYVVENGVAKQRLVKTGISDELRIQVVEGLNKGDRAVVNPADDLIDGAAVKEQ